MELLPGNASEIGGRQQQQDVFALSDFGDEAFVAHGGYLALVADGIGGLMFGAEAAYVAVASFLSSYRNKPVEQDVDQALDDALHAANRAVIDQARRCDCSDRMGTTLVAAVVHRGHLYWRSVGDSHLYLCRDSRLSQLNADHTYARSLQALVAEGLMSQDEADYHPERATLENFIGIGELEEVDHNLKPLPLQAGDKLLLCSDGIDGTLSADEIIACMSDSPMTAAQRLCAEVLAKQVAGQDNLTAVVLAYQGT